MNTTTAEISACSDDHWHHLWAEINRQRGDLVTVKTCALTDVIDCHGGRVPQGLFTKRDRVWSEVNRAPLFDFLTTHGAACGKEHRHG